MSDNDYSVADSAFVPAQSDYDMLTQSIFNIKFKLELMEINGLFITRDRELLTTAKSVSCSISAESDIRRTATIVLSMEESELLVDELEIEWMDRMVRFYIGVETSTDTYTYYLLGTYLLDSDTSSYDATTKELSLSLVDIMACATEKRGNQIGTEVFVPYNARIENAIKAFVARQLPFKFFDVADFPNTIPYDQEFPIGVYPYTVLDTLVSLYPYYEQYYSLNGIYTVKALPTGYGDANFLDETVLDDLIISEERSGVVGNIKNSTEIWGAELDAIYTASNCTVSGSGDVKTYNLVFPTTFENIEANSTYSFVPPQTNVATQYIDISTDIASIIIPNSSIDYRMNDCTTETNNVAIWYSLTYNSTVSLSTGTVISFMPSSTNKSDQTIVINNGEDHYVMRDSNGSVLQDGALVPGMYYVFSYGTTTVGTGEDAETVGCFFLQGSERCLLYDTNGDLLEAGTLVPDRAYVLRFVYVKDDNDYLIGRFVLLGEQSIHVIVREMNSMPTAAEIENDKRRNDCNDIRYIINSDSPYACDRDGKTIPEGEIRQVLHGNDYSYIYTTELAYERAAYENYLKARLNTTVELKTILIPWIDVNKKIQYTSPKTGDVLQYMIKEVSMNPTEFTMTMKLTRFYNAYPWL